MATPDLNDQLAAVFAAGLRADPSLRDSLAEALARDESYTKAEVNYRKAGEGDDANERCGTCTHWAGNGDTATGACDIVAGSINAADVCDKYDHNDDGEGADIRK